MRAAAPYFALALALSFSAASARTAVAQTDDALAAARRLFTEAVADEGAKRFDVALDKFRQVAAVRETANIRYRIGTCLEALGQHAEAIASYDSAVRLGATEDGASEVVKAARERAAKLDPTVARLTLDLPSDAPQGLEVRLDGGAIDRGALASSIALDPGHHTLQATAPGRAPFETAVVLEAGGRVTIAVTLPEQAPSPAPPPAASAGPAGAAPPSAATQPSPAPAPESPSGSGARRTAAWLTIGVGGALAVGSVVSFVLRGSNLSTLHGDCTTLPDGNLGCPPSSAGAVNSAHDEAQFEGPLGIGLAAGAVVAVGVGAWLLATSPHDSGAAVLVPMVDTHGGGLVVQGRLGAF